MSWLVSLATALLSGVVGGAGMFGIAHLGVKWYRISSFEGGSGYYVIFLTLFGAIGGFVAGLVAARVGSAHWSHDWHAQLVSGTGSVLGLLTITLGIFYLGADHEPERGDRGLRVAWEIRLPAPSADDPFAPKGNPAVWPDDELRLQLVSVVRGKPRGYENATFDRASMRQENGQWVLPARVSLFTSKGEFCVNLTLGGRDDGFWPRLATSPVEGDFQWTPWYRTNKGAGKARDADAVMYRFRIEQVDRVN